MPSRISVPSILFDIGRDTESQMSAMETLLITQEQEQNSNYFCYNVYWLYLCQIFYISSSAFSSLRVKYWPECYNALSSNVGQINSTINHTFHKCLRLRKNRSWNLLEVRTLTKNVPKYKPCQAKRTLIIKFLKTIIICKLQLDYNCLRYTSE